jgi:hypothetical protein
MERWKTLGYAQKGYHRICTHFEIGIGTINCLNEMVAMNARWNGTLGQPSAHELQSNFREFHKELGLIENHTEPSYLLH